MPCCAAEVGEPKAEVLQYGPAAEKGVLFSSLVSMANRNNGRTGMGLVMASKNLKAIVVKGKGKLELADPAALAALNKAGPKMMPENPDVDGLGKYGTASVVMFQNTIGSLPTRNYNEGQFEDCEAISGEVMDDTVLKERETCYACVVRCKRVVEIKEGPYQVDPLYGGPEYETLGTFGSYCGISDLAAISLANQICNKYGVDTISCGATIAFAMECFEKGIIGLEQTGGLELRFGRRRSHAGGAEADCARTAARWRSSAGLGARRQAWGPRGRGLPDHRKGQEAPAHMPQAKKSLALIYAVNPFGADHQSSEHDPMYEEGAADLYLERLAELDLKASSAGRQPGAREGALCRLHADFLQPAGHPGAVPVCLGAGLDAVRPDRDWSSWSRRSPAGRSACMS